MSVNAVCPECRAVYHLADQQQGKKVRCKKCDAVFVAGAPPQKKSPPPADIVERPQTKTRPPTAPARRAKPTRARRDDDDDDEEEDSKPRSRRGQGGGSVLPWLVGGGVAALAIVVIGVLVLVLLLRDSPDQVANNNAAPPPFHPGGAPVQPMQVQQPVNPPVVNRPLVNQPIEGQPVAQAANVPPVEVKKPPVAAEEAPRDVPLASNGRLTAEGRERVKQATVYLRVTMPDGSKASGTGFFGSVEARNIVLTNAHVVGMLAPESRRPQAIEVFVHSGEANEWKTTARVLGVDRSSDLAVLDIGAPPKPVPDPLTVKSAGGLHELDEVYVFGFPFGEQLGKEITIRPSSVSSLRKKGGTLDRVQVNGGMDPGNSGGPVVDNSGQVVGVAVSGIPGRQINFAIPGDRVHVILNGRISALAFEQPYFAPGNRIAVPVFMEMIDPRNRVKDVAVEVWSGDKPVDQQTARRPPATTQPGAQPGDSPRLSYKLDYRAGEGRKDILLPELPPGKVWWQQPSWVNAKGETHWAAAAVLRLPTDPVERKPAKLLLHYPQRASRPLTLTLSNILKVSNDEDSDTFRMETEAEFLEKVNSAGSTGSVLSLQYKRVKRTIIDPRGQTHPSKLLDQVKDRLPQLITLLQIDPLGNIIKQQLDARNLRGVTPPQYKQMTDFHRVIQQGLEAMSVSLPPQGTVQPLDSWKAERSLPIDTPGKFDTGKLDMTYTYLGVRKRDNREEAVLNVDGVVRGERDTGDAVGGKATGKVLVDLASGQTILAEISVLLDLDAVALSLDGREPVKIKVMSTMKVRLQRKL